MTKKLKPTSIKFTDVQLQFLSRRAREEKHRKLSRIVKDLVDREMATLQPAARKGAA